jgi:hypothetical protein
MSDLPPVIASGAAAVRIIQLADDLSRARADIERLEMENARLWRLLRDIAGVGPPLDIWAVKAMARDGLKTIRPE